MEIGSQVEAEHSEPNVFYFLLDEAMFFMSAKLIMQIIWPVMCQPSGKWLITEVRK